MERPLIDGEVWFPAVGEKKGKVKAVVGRGSWLGQRVTKWVLIESRDVDMLVIVLLAKCTTDDGAISSSVGTKHFSFSWTLITDELLSKKDQWKVAQMISKN